MPPRAQAFATFGSAPLMDRVERLAFNALPAALTGDMWTHVYVQQANSVFAGVMPEDACDAIAPSEVCDRNFYGVSHFPCCITNFPQGAPTQLCSMPVRGAPCAARGVVRSLLPHRARQKSDGSTERAPSLPPFRVCFCSLAGWPKFAQSAVLADVRSDPPAVVVASLVPVVATVAAAQATVTIESQYPFEDEARITLTANISTPLRIRVPSWATRATIDGKLARN
eukprot:6533429-Prymnesium_polylepis.2